MSYWLPFPMQESLNQDLAIRRFGPARAEQEQGGEEEEQAQYNHYSAIDIANFDPMSTCLAAPEDEEFADSFFNLDHYVGDDSDEFIGAQNQPVYDCFRDNNILEEYPPMENGDYEEFLMFNDQKDETLSVSLDEFDVAMPQMKPQSENVEELMRHGVDQGLHLVHLLLACAEALGCRDTKLAESILSEVWPSASQWGSSLQRVSYYFAVGLRSRLSLLQNVNSSGALAPNSFVSAVSNEEKTEGYQLLNQTMPYLAFGFMAANEAICQASKRKDSLHIVDMGMEHALQWPSLLRTLAARPEGPPKCLRITGLIKNHQPDLRVYLEKATESIVQTANSLGISMEFRMLLEPLTPTSILNREGLDLREGESVIVNSIMHLHKYVKESRGSLKSVLQAIKKLNPLLLTVVEQDANHNGPFFLGRFLESLHYYSAIFDSLEAGLSSESLQRIKIEALHYGEEIRDIVAYEGSNRVERHERADQWRRQLSRAGFQVAGMKSMSQARMMLSVYGCDGYTLSSEKGCLLLGWKGRPIMLASSWHVHSNVNSFSN